MATLKFHLSAQFRLCVSTAFTADINSTGAGTADAKLADVSFTNLTFEYATWRRPSQGDGYVEQQSGRMADLKGRVGSHVQGQDSALGQR